MKKTRTIQPKEYVSYSIGLFGYAMLTGYIGNYLQYFYTDLFLIPPAAIGTMMLVSKIWDGVNDPLEGFIIDRTNTRFGKLRPYILWTSVPMAVITVLMFTVPSESMGTTARIVYMYITYILYGSLCSLSDSPARGIACSTTTNEKERADFISIANILRAIGNSAPLVVILVLELIFKAVNHTDTAPAYQVHNVGAWICGVGGAAMFLMIFFFNKERIPQSEEKLKISECLLLLKVNKPLQIVCASNLIGFGRSLAVGVQVYIATYMLGSSGKMLQLGLPTAVGTMLGMLVVPMLLKRFNSKQTFIGFSLCGSAALTVLYLLGYERIMGNRFDLVFYIFLFLVGLRFGNTNIMPNLFAADAIDYMEWKTGKRTEGTTYAVLGLFDKIAGALSSAVLNWLLVAIGFIQPVRDAMGVSIQQAQSAMTLNGMFALFTIIPALFGVLSVIPFFFYDLVGKKKERMLEELAQRREQCVAVEVDAT